MDSNDDGQELDLLKLSYEIVEGFSGERIDKVLTELSTELYPELLLTRSKIEKLIEQGCVRLDNSEIRSKSFKIEQACVAKLTLSDFIGLDLKGDPDVVFDVVYEDKDLVVIDKPAGLVIHPGDGGEIGTLAHGLVYRYGLKGVGHPKRPGIVHRLDKDTSGLMVVALNQSTLNKLLEQFHPPRKIHRTYFAVTRKPPSSRALPVTGVISASISRDPKNPVKMGVSKEGRAATTKYRFVEEFTEAMLVELELETGRTHQIRVHLENIGIPILGDPTYHRGSTRLSREIEIVLPARQALHAAKLSFEHPETKQQLSFESELPEDIAKLIEALRILDAGQ